MLLAFNFKRYLEIDNNTLSTTKLRRRRVSVSRKSVTTDTEQNSTTLDDLKRHYALYFITRVFFGAHLTYKDRPRLDYQQKIKPRNFSFLAIYIVYATIGEDSLKRRRKKGHWGGREQQFSVTLIVVSSEHLEKRLFYPPLIGTMSSQAHQ